MHTHTRCMYTRACTCCQMRVKTYTHAHISHTHMHRYTLPCILLYRYALLPYATFVIIFRSLQKRPAVVAIITNFIAKHGGTIVQSTLTCKTYSHNRGQCVTWCPQLKFYRALRGSVDFNILPTRFSAITTVRRA